MTDERLAEIESRFNRDNTSWASACDEALELLAEVKRLNGFIDRMTNLLDSYEKASRAGQKAPEAAFRAGWDNALDFARDRELGPMPPEGIAEDAAWSEYQASKGKGAK